MDISNNEAASIENYREEIFSLIPQLKYLDGYVVVEITYFFVNSCFDCVNSNFFFFPSLDAEERASDDSDAEERASDDSDAEDEMNGNGEEASVDGEDGW